MFASKLKVFQHVLAILDIDKKGQKILSDQGVDSFILIMILANHWWKRNTQRYLWWRYTTSSYSNSLTTLLILESLLSPNLIFYFILLKRNRIGYLLPTFMRNFEMNLQTIPMQDIYHMNRIPKYTCK